MSYKSVYTLCILFCLCACRDDRFFNPDPELPPVTGEAIPAAIAWEVEPLFSPQPLSEPTRASGKGSVLQASFPGMDVELSGSPVTRAAASQQDLENKIHSLFILQFNGVTKFSKCVQATYVPMTADLSALNDFSFKATESPVSRIVIIANLSSDYLNMEDWNAGTKTYSELRELNLAQSENESYPLLGTSPTKAVMFGISDVKLEAGTLVTVSLQRIFAKVAFNIDMVPALKTKYTIWQAQLMNIPGRCYFLPVERESFFPTLGKLGTEGFYNRAPVNAVSGVFDANALTYYVPVNIRPDVQFASVKTRTILAPQNTTYLLIAGLRMGLLGNIAEQVVYQIHLGDNLTSNYTISPNYFYNYKIHLMGESPDDGTVVRFVPGYWGGELKAYDETGNVLANVSGATAVKWRYEKKIEVYSTDVVSADRSVVLPWGEFGSSFNGTNLMDGLGNTNNILLSGVSSQFPAFSSCINLNYGDAPQFHKNDPGVWYLPSISQLLATYIAAANLYSTMSEGYWSSTAVNANGDNAYCLTRKGELLQMGKSSSNYVRAIRNLDE